ncbi:hypothetical protein NE865_16599 [Phthorimaea operculella]|nr:hypothetical protein NE865_16599 [Phthorimaea operculella]
MTGRFYWHMVTREKFNNTGLLLFIGGGQLIIQWCFMVSSFLLFYNMEIYAETHKINWQMLVKAVSVRWLRFSPAYAVILGYTMTWMRHFGNGPFYELSIMQEVNSCKRDWWVNLLYLSNFVKSDPCFIQSWYISADFQLFFLGVAVYVLFSGTRRNLVLAGLFIMGVILPPLLTYLKDLDGVLLMSLENVRNLCNKDPTYHTVYNKPYTNLPCYIIGLALGLLVYHLQKIGYQVPKTRALRYLFWMTLPFTFVIAYYGALLYKGEISLVNRTLYAGLYKPLWALIGAFFIFGIVNQIEDVYRGVVEWPGWTVPARLSYSFFLVHLALIRLINGTKTTAVDVGMFNIFELMSSVFLISFIAAFPFHLLVEAPFNQLVKLLMSPSDKQRTDVGKQIIEANRKTPEIANGKDEILQNDKDDNLQNGVRRRITSG